MISMTLYILYLQQLGYRNRQSLTLLYQSVCLDCYFCVWAQRMWCFKVWGESHESISWFLNMHLWFHQIATRDHPTGPFDPMVFLLLKRYHKNIPDNRRKGLVQMMLHMLHYICSGQRLGMFVLESERYIHKLPIKNMYQNLYIIMLWLTGVSGLMIRYRYLDSEAPHHQTDFK